MIAQGVRGCFVTGTGTEVGKTVVAATIARTHAGHGERVAAFKPAVSGLDLHAGSSGEPDHLLLRRAARSQQAEGEIAPYRYGPSVSPHLGAELAGEAIDPAFLIDRARTAAANADLLVCEGVGGFLVPLALPSADAATPPYLVRDFARDLGLPVVIASSPGLGTINHTLLTIEAVRAADLRVAAVVLTPWPTEPGALERSNREAIERLGDVRVETLPELDLATPESWPPVIVAGVRG